jgi:hypothetical protein
MPRRSPSSRVSAGPAFADPEGLRASLTRLHEAGPGAWRHDVEAAELMRFAADRYGALARKYGLEPADAAAAAFEAMLNDSTRTADDPWAVVTVAVRITLIAENRAHGLLTSTERARRPQYSVFHDAERFSDRDNELIDYHPALRVSPDVDGDAPSAPGGETGGAGWVVDDTVTLLSVLGWPDEAAHTGVEYVAARLCDIGDRLGAYETLRRDKSTRALLDLPHEAWIGLLRIVLGHPTAATMSGRRGVLARLLIGDTLTDLLTDDELVLAVATANPACGGADG